MYIFWGKNEEELMYWQIKNCHLLCWPQVQRYLLFNKYILQQVSLKEGAMLNLETSIRRYYMPQVFVWQLSLWHLTACSPGASEPFPHRCVPWMWTTGETGTANCYGLSLWVELYPNPQSLLTCSPKTCRAIHLSELTTDVFTTNCTLSIVWTRSHRFLDPYGAFSK